MATARLSLDKGFLFFTMPDRRITLNQANPVSDVPEDLREHELKQINVAIKTKVIKQVSDEQEEASPTPEPTVVSAEDKEIQDMLALGVAKIKSRFVPLLSKKPYVDAMPMWLEKIIAMEENGKARSGLIKYFNQILETKVCGISGIVDEEMTMEDYQIEIAERNNGSADDTDDSTS